MISENKVCVMATAADGAPHCSLMSYATEMNAVKSTCTLKDTKKYRNLIVNPAVSLLIDTRDLDQGAKPGTDGNWSFSDRRK